MWHPLAAAGNAAADRLAKQVAAKHPLPGSLAVCLNRTSRVSTQLPAFYTRLLGWAMDAQTLFAVGAVSDVLAKFRPPRLPAHTVALCEGGQARCVRCLLPAALLDGRPCQPGSCSHALGALGKGTFCMRCGAYAFSHVVRLAGKCTGRPTDEAAR